MRLPFVVLSLFGACQVDNRLQENLRGHGADTDTGGLLPGTDTGPVYNELGEACDGDDDDGDGEIDEGWPDANANGVADCLDPSCDLAVGDANPLGLGQACLGTGVDPNLPLDDAWNVAVQWQFSAPAEEPDALWSLAQPVVGNLDDDNGDGVVDEEDTPEVVVSLMDVEDQERGFIVALDGATGREKWVWDDALPTGGVIVVDVDADGSPDVVGFDDDARPVALDGDGRVKWRASHAPSSPFYPLVAAADLDGDGTPEVIADDLVLRGTDGREKFSLELGDDDPYRIAAIADVDLDGDQEIAIAGRLFDSDGTLVWDSGERGGYGIWPIVIQADDDDEAEIGFVGNRWTLWEHDGTAVYRVTYGVAQPGPPCAGDFDGDGEAEVAWPAYEQLVLYELDGSEVWSTLIDDESGLAGCSGYDVDGDGALEVLYADESAFRILDGRVGAPRYATGAHRSGTVFEYPTVADIDNDDHAEIVIVSNMYEYGWKTVTAFEHAGDGWPAAGSTWGVHDFTITNVRPDGSVPATPEPSWLAYNVYRARVASDATAPPDLIVEIGDACVLDCATGPVEVAVQVGNQGGENVPAGTWLSLYANDDGALRWIGRWALPAVPARQALDGFVVPLAPGDMGTSGVVAVVDDDGTGLGLVEECDETNNRSDWLEDACP